MEILLNGEPRTVPESIDITALLALLGHAERRVAVEVNREIVPRGRHADHQLHAGDVVELVHAMGGG